MSSELRRIAQRGHNYYAEYGGAKAFVRAWKKVRVYVAYPLQLLLHRSSTFDFDGTSYPYFVHHYNSTWSNERAVEIAIARSVIAGGPRPVLEVGNVLSHYIDIDHEVIDKYEAAPNVKNLDVVDLEAAGTYGLIVSISTLEHVGWDEQPRVPEKVGEAVRVLRAALKEDGEIFLTCPLGHNPYMDELIWSGKLSPIFESFLTRATRRGRWAEVPAQDRDALPGSPEAVNVWVARLGRQ